MAQKGEVLEISVAVRFSAGADDSQVLEQASGALVEASKWLLEIPGAKRFTSGISIRRGLKKLHRRTYARRRRQVEPVDDPTEGKPN